MPQVTFKAKVESVFNMDDSLAYQRIKVPKITQRHCDMSAFRAHPKYSSYANSDLFPGMLARAVAAAGVRAYLRLDQLPASVRVDESGFLISATASGTAQS